MSVRFSISVSAASYPEESGGRIGSGHSDTTAEREDGLLKIRYAIEIRPISLPFTSNNAAWARAQ
jgi:hypothetical protein